ncbi:MAG: response regulator [Elusimicrobiota bacterium]
MNTEAVRIEDDSANGTAASAVTTLLFADDCPAVLQVLVRTFSGPGTRIFVAKDGLAALAAASEHEPDLIVLDIQMPGMNGDQVCQALRRDPAHRHTPILMLTGRGAKDDELHGLDIGADDYIKKPFDIDNVRARVTAHLRRSRTSVEMNPVSRLPGSGAVKEEVERRLHEGGSFTFTIADISGLKAFKDVHGVHLGDAVILATAKLLRDNLQDPAEDFVGHVGGDDFAIVSSRPIDIAALRRRFFERVGGLYTIRQAGREIPLLSLDEGEVFCNPVVHRTYEEVAEAATRARALFKTRGIAR